MRNDIPILQAAALPLASLLLACGGGPPGPQAAGARAISQAPLDADELREDRSVYDQDNLDVVPIIRLTVTDLEGLERVHRDEPGARVEVLFQQNRFAERETRPNGMLSLRGATGRTSNQKSYKIVLADGAGRWRGQKRIHLLKNQYDLTRLRGYLAFEYFKTIPHITSMRHQLVRVYLNGQDLGMYEWFEHSGSRFLLSHGLDGEGALYKVENFAYRPYTEDLFECEGEAHCLEIEENHDPDKVRRMLDAVNDLSRDINDIIATHFQRDNYETWLALNILFSNYDTASQNYFLYSPRRSERWYLLPWDYNGAFDYYRQPSRLGRVRPRTSVAPGYWWQIGLHRRYLSDRRNVESLARRIALLLGTFVSDEKTRRILDRVAPSVRRFIERDPDNRYLPVSDRRMSPRERVAEWEREVARLGGVVSQAGRDFERTVEWPMGVWLGTPSRRGALTRFRWDPSYDLQGDGLTYDLLVARSPRFEPAQIEVERLGLTAPLIELPGLAAGTHYYTVVIRDDADPDEHWQSPFTKHQAEDGTVYFGVKRFTLP